MIEETKYDGLAKRIAEQLDLYGSGNIRDIMELLGYEVQPHGRLGAACRPFGTSHWQSLPRFNSADEAVIWLKEKATFLSMTQGEDRWWTVRARTPGSVSYIAKSKSLGAAMWAAFVGAEGNRPPRIDK